MLALWLDEGRGPSLASFWLADLAFALAGLGREEELARVAGRARTRTRWLEAAEAIGEGDWARAADAFAEIGSLPDEAAARVEAAGHQRTQTSSFGGRAPSIGSSGRPAP